MENKELSHHGILGQRWGRRRYQNKDGTLTPEGVKRYRETNPELYEAKKQEAIRSGKASDILLFKGDLTNVELNTAVGRLEKEAKLSEYKSKETTSTMDTIKKISDGTKTIGDLAKNAGDAYNNIAKLYNVFTKGKKLPTGDDIAEIVGDGKKSKNKKPDDKDNKKPDDKDNKKPDSTPDGKSKDKPSKSDYKDNKSAFETADKADKTRQRQAEESKQRADEEAKKSAFESAYKADESRQREAKESRQRANEEVNKAVALLSSEKPTWYADDSWYTDKTERQTYISGLLESPKTTYLLPPPKKD